MGNEVGTHLNNNTTQTTKETQTEVSGVLVGSVTDFKLTDRKCVSVPQNDKPDRPIVILKVNNNYYALDSRCYHAGGPLEHGDIEEIDNRICIKCPWHRYIIDISSGEGLYKEYNPITRMASKHFKSKGKRQRIHKINIINGKLYIILNRNPKMLESDQYARPMNNLNEGPTINIGKAKTSKT